MFYGKNITIELQNKTIVRDSSLHIDDGEAVIFIGANGAGKTTMLRGLAGLLPLRNGVTSLAQNNRELDFGLSLGPEYLPEKITVKKYFQITGNKNLPKKDNLESLYAKSGLSRVGKKRINTLSTGMKQKISIISALRFSPKNIILDEPHNGLDPKSIDWLNSEIHNLKSKGISILISSHLLREVSLVGDRAYRIEDNRVHTSSWPLYETNNSHIVTTENVSELFKELSKNGVDARKLGENRIYVPLPSAEIFRIVNSKNIQLTDFQECK
ncbi:MAG: ATP-binding cassette domain-containing protein [Rothia sp. (in: high G+C Gram-positive bacteria)]|nr:ATP-binding cassette domain-containing protein [Rothia sp. (in: high G+C Gram-positive bacteria)]